MQRAFDAYQERQEALANEVTRLQNTIATIGTENDTTEHSDKALGMPGNTINNFN